MRIVRSIGESFTKHQDGVVPPLQRSVRRKPGDTELTPDELTKMLKEDGLLRIRQIIAILDKVVHKVKSLKTYEVDAYVDRVHLGEALWRYLHTSFTEAGLGEEAITDLQARWHAKVHPYARKPVSADAPKGDDNARTISKVENGRTREEFVRKWHDVFWRLKQDGYPDYEAIARAILNHLHEQEHILSSTEATPKPRKKGKTETGMGLIEARAGSITRGTNDPREGRRAGSAAADRTWTTDIEKLYFSPDVAAKIFNACTRSPPPNAAINSAYIGQILFEHFGALKDKTTENTDNRKQICDLHTAVRDHYRKLASGERFRRAVRDAALPAPPAREAKKAPTREEQRWGRLSLILPKDKAALLNAIGARKRNASFSELIRLGKMIAHASDAVPNPESPQSSYDNALNWFATSDGQAEIKRNESFVRVWRSAVAQTFSTLRGLVDPNCELNDLSSNWESEPHENPALAGSQSRKAALHLDAAHFHQQLQLVYGARLNASGQSRAALFSEVQPGEMAWALLRLASVIRNRASHFMIRGRFLSLIRDGVLTNFETEESLENHRSSGAKAHQQALDSFDALLDYDKALNWQVILDSLKSLKADAYLKREQIEKILGLVEQDGADPAIMLPRFMPMMKRAKNLVGHGKTQLPGIESLVLKDFENSGDLNRLKVGLLRMVYQGGFQTWLATDPTCAGELGKIVNWLISAKIGRSEVAADEKRRAYVDLDTLLTDHDLARFTTLADLLPELQRLGMQANGDHLRYEANRERQSAMSREIEQFRQELIAVLFGRYLLAKDMNWIWDLSEPPKGQQAIDLFQFSQPEPAPPNAPLRHEAQFYAWLYLLPVETVAKLRHQFRKTMVLDDRALKQQRWSDQTGAGALPEDARSIDDADLVRSMDRLMALYVSVQGAGFAGKEHESSRDLGALLYDDPEQLGKLLSDTNHDENIAGTRSGLREILRFGHLAALEPVFKYHKVTKAEVEQHSPASVNSMRTEFTKKNELREAIIKLIDDRDRDHDELSAKCAEYSKQITTCTLHNFSICAARLNDHIRAHHLMLSVVSRLVDFALMWERDRFYLLLGMLYRQWSDAGQGLQFVAKAIGIDNVMNHGIARGDVEVTNRKLLPIWNEEDGFAFHHDQQLITRAESWLEGEFKADFLRQFKEGSQNPKDIGRKRGPGQTKDYNSGKNKIRNDLAHYNVLHPTKNDRLNLTMLVNAVRSLFGHDRKMKNVIPRAIHDVLAREGVTIDWMIKDDRLRHPLILPVIETHLDKVRPVAGRLAPVMVPQVSVRFVSMVKALFEHDNGGYRALVTDATGRKSRKGVMRYPKELFGKAAGAMPNALESSSIP